ncbi:MAG TPA: 50S ribosomal protein L3 N(5)-glutamine methyltransferase [Stellaceae bacterium]|nr:50S ribosomal protein L3 N(5)-glutamine methyltransferase [Stellaceae bacterium]
MTTKKTPRQKSQPTTIRYFLRDAVRRFTAAKLSYGHGTDNARDEAAFLILEGLRLPIDALDPVLDRKLTARERQRIAGLIDARIATRRPAAYLLGRAYVGGVPFHVDERVIVPRSFLAEVLRCPLLQGDHPGLIGDPAEVRRVLDLCTGSGALAVLAAHAFPKAQIDATEISADALAVARRNIDESGLAARIRLREGDLFAPVAAERYDLILANPPYVDAAGMAELPPECRAEPKLAFDGGADGLDVIKRILKEARAHLAPQGGLLCEVGRGREDLEAAIPQLPLLWLDTEDSLGEVFWIAAADLV